MNRKTKIIICLALVAAIVLGVAITVGVLKAPKKIRIGVSENEPMSYKSSEGNWKGYDVEFANKLFTELEFDEIEFVEVTAVNREKKLKNGEIDCYMSGTDFINAEGLIYTTEYIESKQVFFYSKESGIDITKAEDIKGARVGVLDDSENFTSIVEYNNDENVFEFPTVSEIARGLYEGEIDVAVVDYSYAYSLVEKNAQFKNYQIGIIYDTCPHAIFLPEKKQKLQNKINAKIEEYKEQKYFKTLQEAKFIQDFYY